jgi:hypothetical protein
MTANLMAFRHKLRAAGYSPIPCEGKRPPMNGWDEKINATDDEIRLWSGLYPHATNTGVFTRLVPTIDIDILNPEAAKAVEDLVSEMHAEHGNILVRFGLRPKRAIPFRTDEPFKKITANLVAPDGSEGQKIELLADGQQFIVAGIHPETRKPYGWFGGELDETPREELPYIREDDARALVEAAVELLIRDFGYSRAAERPKERAKANGHDEPDGSADWAYLKANIRAGRDLHESTLILLAKYMTAGMGEGAAVNAVRAEMELCTAPHDARWQDRYDDLPRLAAEWTAKNKPNKPKIQIIARPYSWPDPAKIPPRQFLYGRHYIRKTIGATIGAGGRGKTTLGPLEFVGMACGRNLLTGEEFEPLRVWMLNAEEEQDELDRRTAAICKRYEISEVDCGDRLFMQSVLHTPMRFATLIETVPVLDRAVLDPFEAEITARRIDVFGLDPWVSFHSLNESSNEHMDLLIKEGLRNVASRTGSAGEIFHHPGKPKPGQAKR